MNIAASRQSGSNARHVALRVLLACRRHDAFVQQALDQHLASSSLCGADRRLTAQLAYGVLRRRATIDALMKPFITRPFGPGKESLEEALRLGVYQLAFMKVPVHAAVHESVELVGVAGLKGFANAVLRNVTRLLTDDIVLQPSADALPLENGQYRRLAKLVLPSPAEHPVQYLAAGFALPQWLVRRWLARLGWEECLRLGWWFAATPSLWVRANTLRTTRAALLTAWQAADIAAEPGEHPEAVKLLEHRQVRDLPGFAEGWFAVQDAAAVQIASVLNPQPGDTVLDLCAAPGTKTTHLAALMHNQGHIVACDVDESRLKTLRDLAGRLGVNIIQTQKLDTAALQDVPPGPFDAILVDAPCSNSGVLARRPEARWRLGERDVAELAKLQTKLLLLACERLKPGGKLVYSTCSIEPHENQDVVRTVLHELPQFTLDGEQEMRPGLPADGGFWALLRKR
jgi:16S rRNA (cytosine967-C5)-methyltransferase